MKENKRELRQDLKSIESDPIDVHDPIDVQSALKQILIIIATLVGLLIVVVAMVVLIFLFGEWQRSEMLKSYEMPHALMEQIISAEHGVVGALMSEHETMMCAIDGYGDVANISSLNAKQKNSLPKEKLPSEGLTWYLLFFNDGSISRINLVGTMELGADTRDTEAGCVNRNGYFEIQKRLDKNGNNEFVMFITSERKIK